MRGVNQRVQGVLLLAVTGALWGFNGLYVQVMAQLGLSSLSIVFVRYLCALMMLAPVVSAASAHATRNVLALRPQHLACCVGLGLVSNALGSVLSAYAIAEVGVSITTVLLYTAPVFGCLMSWRLFGEHLTRNKLAAIACNFAGVVLVVAGGGLLGPDAGGGGLAAGLGYGLTYALTAVFSRPIAGKCHPLAVVYYCSLTAVAALALPALGTGDLALVLQPAGVLASLAYGGISTVAANVLYQRGLSMGVETSRVAVITSVEVAVSAFVGTVAFGEALSVGKVVGIGCVLGSIVLMNAHAKPGEVHGVRMFPMPLELHKAFVQGDGLAAATNDVNVRRERFLAGER